LPSILADLFLRDVDFVRISPPSAHYSRMASQSQEGSGEPQAGSGEPQAGSGEPQASSVKSKAGSVTPHALQQEILAFLATCAAPAVLEPGDEILPLADGGYSLDCDAEGLLLECWCESRSLRRRIVAIRKRARSRLELDAERFPRRRCSLSLIDTQAHSAARFDTESARGVAREELRRWCERFHPGWRMEALSAAPDLQHSLSPRFPRALLHRGSDAVAAIAAPMLAAGQPSPDVADIFTFGLIWLQHCRQRWPEHQVRTLLLFVPEPAASGVALRLIACNHAKVRYRLIAVSAEGALRELAPRSWGNLATELATGSASPPHPRALSLFQQVAQSGLAHCVQDLHGQLSLEVRGLPIARAVGDEIRVGLKLRRTPHTPSVAALLRLTHRVARLRSPESVAPHHALYGLYPERWLESQIRAHISAIDPTIQPATLRRQVTGAIGAQPTRTDLLALDDFGRLVILEVKATEDIHLPAQALDYYSRLKLQLERGDLQAAGLFPGYAIHPQPPRILLIAPALSFHPTNETVLSFLESTIQVRQVGIALEWRKQVRVVFQHVFTDAAPGGTPRWPPISFSKSVKRSPR
jgi:hypothetical protein